MKATLAAVFGLLKNKMIITKLSGGLGNQMFQYACGLSLSNKSGTLMKIDTSAYIQDNLVPGDTIRKFELDKFNISCDYANIDETQSIKYPLGSLSKIFNFIYKKLLRVNHLDFHPGLFKMKTNQYLDGYFQSEKNFINVADTIRKEFTLKRELIDAAVTEFERKVFMTNSVSIHIRRGDYAQDRKTNLYHGLCPISYYEQAIAFMTSKVATPYFFIFSDDIDWVKKNIKITHPHMFVSGNNFIPQQEMHIMSKCKHNIIANSTFSWWGAWLNQNPDKIVVAPKKWVNIKPNPHPNIIPETWITM